MALPKLLMIRNADGSGTCSIAEERSEFPLAELISGEYRAAYFKLAVTPSDTTACRVTFAAGKFILHDLTVAIAANEPVADPMRSARPDSRLAVGEKFVFGAGVTGTIGTIYAVRPWRVPFDEAAAMTRGARLDWPVQFERVLRRLERGFALI